MLTSIIHSLFKGIVCIVYYISLFNAIERTLNRANLSLHRLVIRIVVAFASCGQNSLQHYSMTCPFLSLPAIHLTPFLPMSHPTCLPPVFLVCACPQIITPCIIGTVDTATTSITAIPVLGNVNRDTKLHH